MNIYTSYFGFFSKIPQSMIPVSIARFPPKWFRGEEIKALAPEKKLLWKAKQNKICVEEYTHQYMKCVTERFDPRMLYEKLRQEFSGSDIVLLCFERKGEFCHRRLLAEWLENTLGLNVPEL